MFTRTQVSTESHWNSTKTTSSIKDSLINEENLRKVIKMESNFQMDQKIAEDSIAHSKEILLHEAEADQRKAELRAAQYLQYGLIGGVLLLLGFVLFVNKRFQVSRKQNKIISKQKEILQDQNEQVQSAKQSLEIKQKEVVDSLKLCQTNSGSNSSFKQINGRVIT